MSGSPSEVADWSLETAVLPTDVQQRVDETLAAWRASGNVRRLWSGDASLWSGADEAAWLGWLSVVDELLAQPDHFAGIGRGREKRWHDARFAPGHGRLQPGA